MSSTPSSSQSIGPTPETPSLSLSPIFVSETPLNISPSQFVGETPPNTSPSQFVAENPSTSQPSPQRSVPSPDLFDYTFTPSLFTEWSGPIHLPDAVKVDFFRMIFYDEIIDLILEQTNLYGTQNPPPVWCEWEPVTRDAVHSFLGVLILTGLKKLPMLRDYWSRDPLLGCPEIVESWPLRKFLGVLHCMHLNDNSNSTRSTWLTSYRPITS